MNITRQRLRIDQRVRRGEPSDPEHVLAGIGELGDRCEVWRLAMDAVESGFIPIAAHHQGIDVVTVNSHGRRSFERHARVSKKDVLTSAAMVRRVKPTPAPRRIAEFYGIPTSDLKSGFKFV